LRAVLAHRFGDENIRPAPPGQADLKGTVGSDCGPFPGAIGWSGQVRLAAGRWLI